MDASRSMSSFYNDKVIFITGGSGFLGKVVIEKLLRCCPGVKKILMLLRTKKERTAEERIKSLFNIEVNFYLFQYFFSGLYIRGGKSIGTWNFVPRKFLVGDISRKFHKKCLKC